MCGKCAKTMKEHVDAVTLAFTEYEKTKDEEKCKKAFDSLQLKLREALIRCQDEKVRIFDNKQLLELSVGAREDSKFKLHRISGTTAKRSLEKEKRTPLASGINRVELTEGSIDIILRKFMTVE